MNLILALVLLAVPTDPTALSSLNTMQAANGGFMSAPWGDGDSAKPSLRTTRTALRAYRLLNGKPPNREKIVDFLKSCYDSKSGGFSSEPGVAPDPISTSVALMILGELDMPVAGYLERGLQFMNDHTQGFEQVRMVASSLEELDRNVPNAHKWLEEIRQTQNSDGSFGSGHGQARATALNVVAEMRLGLPTAAEPVVNILRKGQREDGGFGSDKLGPSDLESCYRIVRLFHRLGASPNDPDKLLRFIDRCKNDDGGYGRTPDEKSSLHGTYYATIIRGWLADLTSQVHKKWDFEKMSPDALPAGWRQEKTLRAKAGSQWRIETDSSQPANHFLKQSSADGEKKQFNLCVSAESIQDLSLSVKLRAKSGLIDRGGGIVWRYRDSDNYYIARWNPLESNLRIYKVVNGVRTQLDTAEAPGDPNAWHTIKIVTVGRDIRGYLDGKLLAEAEDDEFAEAGAIGLWTKADAVTEFDDLSMTSAWKEMIAELK